MKKLTMICMSALLMLAVSCKKDKKTEVENAGSGFRATVESHEGTGKTHLEGLAVKWDSGDAILVKSSTCTTPKRFTTTGTDASANFVAAESLDGNFYTPDYTGYYPADKFSGNQLTLPATQQYDENNTFASGANPMAATSSDNVLPFKNVCGVLKLQLHNNSGSPCKVANITITSNKEGEKLWGTGAVGFDADDNNNPTLGALTGGGSTLTLNCNGETMSVNSSSPSTYFFVVPVGTLGTSFTVKVTETNGNVWSKTATATQNTIARSKITAMPELAVTTTKPIEFTVDADGTTVEFSPGNLYWDGTESKFKFEANQWDTKPAYSETVGGHGTWDASHVSHFFWSQDAAEATKEEFNWGQSVSTEDEFFTNSSSFQVAGEKAGTWRTLTLGEWNYLLGYDPEEDMQTEECGRPNAKSLCAMKELDGGTHKGLVILPDGTDASVMESITSTSHLATYSAVFLPAAGFREGTVMNFVGELGYYWSSTPGGDYLTYAYEVGFFSGEVYTQYDNQTLGNAVRLVR